MTEMPHAEAPLFYCLKINPDFSFAVFAVQVQKPKRWYGLDCSDPNNPITSVGAPVDMIGEFPNYETAAEMSKRADALRKEFDLNLRILIAKGLPNA